MTAVLFALPDAAERVKDLELAARTLADSAYEPAEGVLCVSWSALEQLRAVLGRKR